MGSSRGVQELGEGQQLSKATRQVWEQRWALIRAVFLQQAVCHLVKDSTG